MPANVAVEAGESVTWTRASPGSPHNVHFEDGALTSEVRTGSFTVTRSFTTEGTYRYYCQVHGGDGGVGMSGVAHVNAAGVLPPVATFTVSPNPGRTGESVSFNGSGSSATGASIVKYAWDLDGDGSFETDTGTTPTASRSYAAPQRTSVKLRVTDGRGATGDATRSLTVNAPNVAPTAAFTISPDPAQTGQSVTFDGSASRDSDGTIRKHEWDLGDGLFEIVSFGAPLPTSRVYAGAGTLSVKLRVTDDDAATAETSRSLTIDAAHQPGAPPPPPLPLPVVPEAAFASFKTSPKSLRVSRTGGLRYAFVTTALRTGKIGLRSANKVRIGRARQFVKLADKPFKASAQGHVKVALKLSKRNLTALKKARRLRFVVSVTIAGKTFTSKLTLKAPGKR